VRRVLLIAYYFPPQPKAGALRPSYLAANLREFGWEPTVLTVAFPGDRPSGCEVVAVPQPGAQPQAPAQGAAAPEQAPRRSKAERYLRGLARSIVFFPDDQVGWLWKARAEALRLTASEKFDAVLSTAPPISAHFVGRSVAKARGIPWVADYRDLWAGPAGPYFDREFGPVRRSISYATERWLLKRASALTAPTDGHAKALAEYFSRPDAEMIPNASDMSIWDSIDVPAPTEFSFCYAGKLYPRLRTPDVVFAAIAKLRAASEPAGAAARFDFYGEDPAMVAESAERYGITDAVRIHGEVPRRRALEAQRGSAVLLLLLNTAGDLDPIEIANPGSKILEYAGARRPILAVGSPRNAMEATMRQTQLGLFASDEGGCATAIRSLYADFSKGKIEPDGIGRWKPFTPRDLAERFARTLDRVSQAR
jgi:glycosyltransferase involved in cell wall biosynthesis